MQGVHRLDSTRSLVTVMTSVPWIPNRSHCYGCLFRVLMLHTIYTGQTASYYLPISTATRLTHPVENSPTDALSVSVIHRNEYGNGIMGISSGSQPSDTIRCDSQACKHAPS